MTRKRSSSSRKKMIIQRFYFLLETILIFLGIFLTSIILIPLSFLESYGVIYGISFYLVRAMTVIVAVTLFMYVSNFALYGKRGELILERDISPPRNFLGLFGIKRSNFKFQLLYGILILFLVFIPIDFLTYFFAPQMLVYSAEVLTFNISNSYFSEPYLIFLGSVIIIQFSVAFYEESLTRGFLANRGSDYIPKMSAVIMSSFYFGMGHFAYIFSPASPQIPTIFPFIWLIEAFFIGIVLSMTVLRRRWIFPAIFAHGMNNIISAHAIWNYLQGNDFMILALFLYLPLMIIGVVLLLLEFPLIKESLSLGTKELKLYLKNEVQVNENTGSKIIRILLDFLFGFLIFVIGFVFY
ncbi:MAG: CPBP family intramembrane metalloprotease [Candidatus Lokiarchaeota archaeon]|nr:CPBP family intramembrane metalloprotease [Candidatus Lokiarchaeota archaeon]